MDSRREVEGRLVVTGEVGVVAGADSAVTEEAGGEAEGAGVVEAVVVPLAGVEGAVAGVRYCILFFKLDIDYILAYRYLI